MEELALKGWSACYTEGSNFWEAVVSKEIVITKFEEAVEHHLSLPSRLRFRRITDEQVVRHVERAAVDVKIIGKTRAGVLMRTHTKNVNSAIKENPVA